MEYNAVLKAFSFGSAYGTFLATELDGRVSFDRLWRRSFEHWIVEGIGEGTLRHDEGIFHLVSAQRKYLTQDEGNPYRAHCEGEPAEGSRIQIFGVTENGDTKDRHVVDFPDENVAVVNVTASVRVLMMTTMKPQRMWSETEREIQIRSLLNWKRLDGFLRVVVTTNDAETAALV